MPRLTYGNLIHKRRALWRQPYSVARENQLKEVQALIDQTPEGGVIARHKTKQAKGWSVVPKRGVAPKPSSFDLALSMYYDGLTAEEAQYIQGQMDLPSKINEEQRKQHMIHGEIVSIVKGRMTGNLDKLYAEIKESEKRVRFLRAQQELPLPKGYAHSVIGRAKYRAASVLQSPIFDKVTVRKA